MYPLKGVKITAVFWSICPHASRTSKPERERGARQPWCAAGERAVKCEYVIVSVT